MFKVFILTAKHIPTTLNTNNKPFIFVKSEVMYLSVDAFIHANFFLYIGNLKQTLPDHCAMQNTPCSTVYSCVSLSEN